MAKTYERNVGRLHVNVYPSREEMGAAAGRDVSERIKVLHDQQDIVRIIFAAAPSQNELLKYLSHDKNIDWQRIDVFHMDEYIGLTQDSPQSFSYFLTEHLFKAVKPRKVHLMNKYQNVVLAQQQYANLVSEAPIDIVCLGVGENGHLAFNDPPVADFNDRKLIKVVTLDEACRCQQVNDGCFKEIEQVPERALTLTIPALLSGKFLFCVVPGKSKSEAIKNLVEGEIATSCPASILRTHNNCTLYVDEDAYTKITN